MRRSPRPTAVLARPWRGLGGLLLLVTLLLGVVTMHAMSGSSSHHGVAVVSAQGEASSGAMTAHGAAHGAADRAGRSAPHGVEADDAAPGDVDLGAMCLMVLLTLVLLPLPSGVLLAVRRVAERRCGPTRPRTRAGTAPSLHALGISRT